MAIENQKDHIERHKKLHRNLDELLADYISHADGRPSHTILELIDWSYKQT